MALGIPFRFWQRWLQCVSAAAALFGVFGGMVMARAQLDVSFAEFMDRFIKAISVTTGLIGIGKAPVFAFIIVVVGCFQGFRTKGGADSVGRQTTRAVVQSIFLVIVADALFSIAFSALDSAFHDEIVVIARHKRLSRLWTDVRAQFDLWLARIHRRRERVLHDVREATLKSHREMIEVLKTRKPDVAADLMERHCSWSGFPDK